MSSVGSSSTADSSLDDDVADDTLFWVERLLESVGLEVVEQVEDVLAGLLGPSAIVVTYVLAHSLATWTSSVLSEGNDALVGDNILDVLDSLEQVESLAGSGSLVRVLVVSSQVIDSALHSCKTNNNSKHQKRTINQTKANCPSQHKINTITSQNYHLLCSKKTLYFVQQAQKLKKREKRQGLSGCEGVGAS